MSNFSRANLGTFFSTNSLNSLNSLVSPTPSSAPSDQDVLIADTKYGRDISELYQALPSSEDRRYLGLPVIIFIGSQSAGKSSLVEAISGIPVPRSAGTGTRCPIECRMCRTPPSSPWTCQISLRWEYDEQGNRLQTVLPEIEFGGPIMRRQDVEPMLKRAQTAILNPTAATTGVRFDSMSDNELSRYNPTMRGSANTLRFTKNTVCLTISGPSLLDLTFVDLPGLVQSLENDVDGTLVTLVEDLTKSYLTKNTIIMTVVSMEYDFENQKATNLAKQADPEGVRTIGVLTKPDKVDPNSAVTKKRWLSILLGETYPTKHGWYCTVQPDRDTSTVGPEQLQARDAEDRFFNQTGSWLKKVVPNRCGTRMMVRDVSRLLWERVREVAPEIKRKARADLMDADKDMIELPSDEPVAFVDRYLMRLHEVVRSDVYAWPLLNIGTIKPSVSDIVPKNRHVYAAFKEAVQQTAPVFVPFDPDEGAAPPEAGWRGIGTGMPMFLRDIRERVELARGRQLTRRPSWIVTYNLVLEIEKDWGRLAMGCFEDIYDNFHQFVAFQIDQVFDSYENLKAPVSECVLATLDAYASKTRHQLEDEVKHEKRFVETQFMDHFDDECEKIYNNLKQIRSTYTGQGRGFSLSAAAQSIPDILPGNHGLDQLQSQIQLAESLLGELGISIGVDDLRVEAGCKVELELMSEVRAYFEIAYKRFVDAVVKKVDNVFLFDFADSLREDLRDKLGLNSPESRARCEEYLTEDITRRDNLVAKKDRSEKVLKALEKLGL